jgi:hypothetical protein
MGAVVFDAQVHGFRVVTQQCGGGLELFVQQARRQGQAFVLACLDESLS